MKYTATIFFILLCGLASAQTCTGGLGDPIVNITFGKGPAPGPALASGITNLAWTSENCTSDGEYTLTNYINDCWGGTWVTISQDHTGDPNGYFMLINASFDPSDFYVQRIDGLCGGTSYQLGAWIINMCIAENQIRPNITFSVEKTDGTVLQTYSTGAIPPTSGGVKWKQYAFYFNTPPGVSSVVLRMTNNAPGGDGNDLALDDITFRAAGPSITTTLAGSATDTISFCHDNAQTLHLSSAVENCFASAVYQWQLSTNGGADWQDIQGATGLTYDRSPAPGIDLYRMTVAEASNAGNSSCSIVSPPVLVRDIPAPLPAVTIHSTPYVCAGNEVLFNASTVDGGADPLYQWKLNGVDAGADDSVFTIPSAVSMDVVSCVMTSNAECVTDPAVISNTLSVPVIPIPVSAVDIAASAMNVCVDSLVSFTATPFNGGDTPSYQWMVNGMVVDTTDAVYVTRSLKDGDLISCGMTGDLSCSQPVTAPEVISMTVYPLPTILLTPDTIIAGGTGIRLTPVLGGDIVKYQWSPVVSLDDPTVAEPFAKPISTTTYQLDVVTAEGCRATGGEKIEVYYEVQMPGAFTPNGDGHNDIFRVPPSIAVNIHRLAVYNRQGGMIYSTVDVSKGWDGTVNGNPQPAGVYVWVIEYDDPLTKRMEMKRGTVVLVR